VLCLIVVAALMGQSGAVVPETHARRRLEERLTQLNFPTTSAMMEGESERHIFTCLENMQASLATPAASAAPASAAPAPANSATGTPAPAPTLAGGGFGNMFGDFNQGSHPPARTQAGGGAGTIGNFSVLEGKSEEEQRLLQIQLLTQAANNFRSLANAKKILPWEEADQVIEQVSDNARKGMEALQAANGAMLELQPHLARAIIVNGQQLLKQDGSVKADHGMRSMMHALLDHQALNMGQPALPANHNNHMIGFEFNKIPGDLLLRRESRKVSIDIMKNVTSKRNPSTFVEVTTGPLFREMLERLFELASVIHGEEPMHKAEKKWRGCLKSWREAKWQVEWCILVWLTHCEEFSSHLRQ
jgi:hypothetical protein